MQPTPDNWPTPSLQRRMACWIYEGLLVFSIVFFSTLLFTVFTSGAEQQADRRLLQALLFLVLGAYFGWFWHRGQTLAMKTWRIQLLDRHGQTVKMTRALLRYLFSWIWFAPPLLVATFLPWTKMQWLALALLWIGLWCALSLLRPDRQFWHDAWAGTRLTLTPPAPKKKTKQS